MSPHHHWMLTGPLTYSPLTTHQPVFARWPIRNKLLRCAALLLGLVLTLSASTFYASYAYRGLVKSLGRLTELRLVNELVRRVSELRLTVLEISRVREAPSLSLADSVPWLELRELQDTLRERTGDVRAMLSVYRDELELNAERHQRLGGGKRELKTVSDIAATLDKMDAATLTPTWWEDKIGQLRLESEELQAQTGKLPSLLRRNILKFTSEVRGVYRTFLFLAYSSLALTVVVIAVLVRMVYRDVFQPLRMLVEGSRKVAAGNFDHRVELASDNEMRELAGAMNDMTVRFLAVRDQLDRQVQERTRQIVQSERQATVGFLAAGVSHEINNPLASIAMSAESLERRLSTLSVCEIEADMRNYVRMIGSEAARCQGITAKLIDFSRMGEARRQRTRLGQLVREVVEVIQHVGKFRGKRVDFKPDKEIVADVHPEEIKQVVLNLLTNALESIAEHGHVEVRLRERDGQAEISVRDNGCGMSEEVLEHLFEPFFTRRQGGQGTGLGLAISDRIISDHGGQITAASDGPGHGAEFRVRLPLKSQEPAAASLLARAA